MKSSDLLPISSSAHRSTGKFLHSEAAEHGQAVVPRELRRKCFVFPSVRALKVLNFSTKLIEPRPGRALRPLSIELSLENRHAPRLCLGALSA
jgi:hypothetical protein